MDVLENKNIEIGALKVWNYKATHHLVGEYTLISKQALERILVGRRWNTYVATFSWYSILFLFINIILMLGKVDIADYERFFKILALVMPIRKCTCVATSSTSFGFDIWEDCWSHYVVYEWCRPQGISCRERVCTDRRGPTDVHAIVYARSFFSKGAKTSSIIQRPPLSVWVAWGGFEQVIPCKPQHMIRMLLAYYTGVDNNWNNNRDERDSPWLMRVGDPIYDDEPDNEPTNGLDGD